MGLWIGKPRWNDGEASVWSAMANREEAGGRQVGGRLYLTNHRLFFQPNRFDARTGARPWWTLRGNVVRVADLPAGVVVDGRESPVQLRRRLYIQSTENQQDVFTVNHVAEKVAELSGYLALDLSP